VFDGRRVATGLGPKGFRTLEHACVRAGHDRTHAEDAPLQGSRSRHRIYSANYRSFPRRPRSKRRDRFVQPNGATITANNAFFQDLGTNGRRCVTCHQPQNGWSVSAKDVAERFDKSAGTDPIFRLVDGATCPSDDVSTPRARRRAYKLLTEKGLIRIGLAIPVTAEFIVSSVDDPYGCNTNPDTGIVKQTPTQTIGILSMYRRPLPSTNIVFDSAIMWDGRESPVNVDLDTGFRNQALDATLGHAQAATQPTPEQVDQIVKFQKGLFTAQVFDDKAKFLTGDNATGGPVALSSQQFFIGINDPLGGNPTETSFTSSIFNIFQSWLNAGSREDHGQGTPMASEDSLRRVNITDAWRYSEHERNRVNERRRSVARGEEVFNIKGFAITGVAGLNDKPGLERVDGFCGTCHDAPNVGNHSVKLPIDIGVPDAGDKKPPVLDIAGLPVFTLKWHARSARREDLSGYRSGQGHDHWQVRRYRTVQGTNLAWTRGARTVFP